MPRRAAIEALADQNAAPGGVATLDRALSILSAFTVEKPSCSLAELAAHTRMHKSTLLRMLASLEHALLIIRQADGRYMLGTGVGRLHRVFQASYSLADTVMPALRALVDQTLESAAFYVPQGDQRLCLYRCDSPRPVRDHMKAGDLLPLNRGAGGRMLSAYLHPRAKGAAEIRRQQVIVLEGDRVPELSGIAAGVFGPDGIVGSLTLIMPTGRLNRAYAQHVLSAARALTHDLGGQVPPN